MITIILIVLYVLGAVFAYNKMKNWSHTTIEKIGFAAIWPLVGILYGIYYLHNK